MAMIAKIWAFVSKPANLAVLIALGGGVAWLWAEFKPKPAPDNQSIAAPVAPDAGQTAEADNGSTAINARDNASVTISK
jgi:hypothetical protein